jgi:pentatricopeptide repeat protein
MSLRLGFHNLEPALAAAAEALFGTRSPPRAVLRRARALHALLVVSSLPSAPRPPTFLVNQLLALYCRLSAVPDALALLRSTPCPSVISYNTVLSALSRTPRHAQDAFGLFRGLHSSGLRPTAPSLCAVLRAAGALRDGRAGAAAHAQAAALGFLASDIVPTALLQMYSGCGSPRDANQVFDEMMTPDVVAWNCVMHCNVRYDYLDRALRKFCRMVSTGLAPTESTLSSVLSGCGRAGDLHHGRALHGWVVKSEELDPDLPLHNALLDMYCCCGDLDTAVLVFQRIETPDLVSWNTIISGFSGVADGWTAVQAFVKLKAVSSEWLAPDEYTFAAVVAAAASLPAMCSGKPLHACVIKAGLESSVFVANTLLNMYFTNEDPGSAHILFDSVMVKDVIMWTEMVAGHSALGEGELSLKYFIGMLEVGHKADNFSLSSALNSAADLAGLKQGEMLHAQVVKSGYEGNICVSGSLVDMYAKNGTLLRAYSVFCTIQKPDLKCWNAMIGGYGNHGDSEMAFKLFGDMIRSDLQPDHVTYISLLSTCSHCGLVEKGKLYWFCMINDGIVPGFKHYTSMVGLLSRAGLLEEAVELINKSPSAKRYPELWRILLSSSVTFKNLSIGVHAAEQALELDPDDLSTHILLSNLYASIGKWDSVSEIRRKIRGLMIEKEPGLSWIEIEKMVHVFSADDECHTRIDDCRDELLRIMENMVLLDSYENEIVLNG